MSRRSWHNFNYITCEEAVQKNIIEGKTLEDYQAMAADDRICCVCDEPIWHLLNELDMCFSCCTGETDASNDYELI